MASRFISATISLKPNSAAWRAAAASELAAAPCRELATRLATATRPMVVTITVSSTACTTSPRSAAPPEPPARKVARRDALTLSAGLSLSLAVGLAVALAVGLAVGLGMGSNRNGRCPSGMPAPDLDPLTLSGFQGVSRPAAATAWTP